MPYNHIYHNGSTRPQDLPQTLNSNEEKEDDCTPKKVHLQTRSLRNDIYRQKLHRHYTWCSLREFQGNKNAHKIHGSNNALREKQTNCEASHLQKRRDYIEEESGRSNDGKTSARTQDSYW